MSVLFAALFLALCLVGIPDTAQPHSPERTGSSRPIELTPEPTGEEPEVFIGPGVSTMFSFDAELLRTWEGREAVILEPRDAFTLVDQGLTTLKLVPSETLKAGARVRLRVRFRDEAAPVGAAFTLVVSATQAERVVDVYRDARPVESYRQDAKEARAATARGLDELERTRAERAGPEGLMGLLVSKQVGKEGVITRDLSRLLVMAPGTVMEPTFSWSYRSAVHVAVELVARMPAGTLTWTTEGALLTGKRGRESKALIVWQSGPVTDDPNQLQRIVVGVAARPGELRGTYSLKLWEAGTGRAVTFNNVSFP